MPAPAEVFVTGRAVAAWVTFEAARGGEVVGVTVSTASADPDVLGPRDAACLDLTAEQAETLSEALAEWAAVLRARRGANDTPPLLALLGAGS